jgi:hypothetical protein
MYGPRLRSIAKFSIILGEKLHFFCAKSDEQTSRPGLPDFLIQRPKMGITGEINDHHKTYQIAIK